MPHVHFEKRENLTLWRDLELKERQEVVVFDDLPTEGSIYLCSLTVRGLDRTRDGELQLFDNFTVRVSTDDHQGKPIPGVGFIDDKMFQLVVRSASMARCVSLSIGRGESTSESLAGTAPTDTFESWRGCYTTSL